MENNKNCTLKKGGYVSGDKPSHLGSVFNFSCSGSARPRKVVKTQLYWREMIRIAPKRVSVCFAYKIESFDPEFRLCQLLWYPGLEKSSKFVRNIFQLYWLKNDMNCTTNYVGRFRVQNWVIWARFSTLLALVGLRPKNVVKSRPKQFSAILTTNDKNCTPNCLGMFFLQNRVIRARLSTLPSLGLLWWYPGLEKSSKLEQNIV